MGYKRGTDYTSRGYSAFDANRDPEGADSPMGASMGGLVASMVKSSIGNDEIDPANAKFKVSQTTTRSDRVDPDSGLSQVMVHKLNMEQISFTVLINSKGASK